jgi:exopolyphosphatase/guanosine-5'-triphosphate,3'-diphosphate pyrophosphatase
VATSATRDAANRDEFTGRVSAVIGVEPEVVSGDEEAALSFAGATRELGPAGSPYLVVDIGGGSTELVLGEDNPIAWQSIDVGCVRLTERHLRSDPPTRAELAAATADVDAALDAALAAVPVAAATTLVGLAGSVTTVAAFVLGLDRYRPEHTHRARLASADVVSACDDLLGMTRSQRAALPFMHPGRVDVIGAGGLIWRRIVERVGRPDVLVSEHDILDGIAWSLAGPAPGP